MNRILNITLEDQTPVSFDANKSFVEPIYLTSGEVLDIAWVPPFLTVMNGAMETPQEEVRFKLSAELIEDNEPPRELSWDTSIEWTTILFKSFLTADEARFAIHNKARPFTKKYMVGGCPATFVPLKEIVASQKLFPLPNVSKTNSSGSLRVTTCRVDNFVAGVYQMLSGGVDEEWQKRWYQQGLEFCQFEGLRGNKVYYREESYRLWDSTKDPGIPYRGYGATKGGFANLFGIPKPPDDCTEKEHKEFLDQEGVAQEFGHECPPIAWDGNGYGVCDPQHLELGKLVMFAISAKCAPAAMSAICGLESIMKVMTHEKFAGQRATGHAMREAAVICGGLNHIPAYKADCERIATQHIPTLLTIMEARNRIPSETNSYRHMLPGTDYGSSTDGGHLDQKDMQTYYELLGIPDNLKSRAAESVSGWMIAIETIGLHAVSALVPEDYLDAHTRQRINFQQDLRAHALMNVFTGRAYNVHTGKVELPAKGVWDEIAPVDAEYLPPVAVPCAEDGGPNFNTGVAIRWIREAFEIYGTILAKAKDRAKATELADLLDKKCGGWYNGSNPLKYNLDSYLHGHRVGFVS